TIEDAIGNALPWSRHYENLGDIESDGFSLGVLYAGDRLRVRADYLNTDATLEGEELTRYSYGYLGTTTGDALTVDLSYGLTASVELGWIGQFVKGVDDIYVEAAQASIDKPGYSVH